MSDPDGFVTTLIEWERKSSRTFPWRNDPTPYEIIVAEVLLQATFAEKVAPVYKTLIERYPEPEALARANESELKELLRPLGLQQRKATWLRSIGQRLIDDGSPESYEDIKALPGVGEYGANAILCFGFGERRPIVDTNVIRIYNRLLSLDLKDSEDANAWELSEAFLPERDFEEYNLALLDLGAEICTSQDPACKTCPVNDYCDYYAKIGDA